MPKPASKLNRFCMSCLGVMVVFVTKVMVCLMVFWMYDLVGHLNVGSHFN